MELQFIDPEVKDGQKVVKVSQEEVASQLKRWENAVVGYVLGEDPSLNSMKNFIDKNWSPHANVKLCTQRSPGVFMFNFETPEEKQGILEKGPWSFETKPFVLKPWSPDIDLEKKGLKSVTTWIKLPNLKLQFWSPQVLSKIASVVGKPLFTDKLTATGESSHPRIFVSVSCGDFLPFSVTIEDHNGRSYNQMVEYEWRPLECPECKIFEDSDCPILEAYERRNFMLHRV